MGHAADPEKTRESRRPRHGAHLRCAHERHELRRLHSARRAGSFVGGPLALVQTGDEIEIDVAARRIHLHVSDEELARRRTAWTPPPPRYARGYGAMYSQHIGQADEGCDFDFCKARRRSPSRRFTREGSAIPAKAGIEPEYNDALGSPPSRGRAARSAGMKNVGATIIAIITTLLFAALPACAQSPAFRVDPYSAVAAAQQLESLGQVGGISVDAQDNIWVFQRPRSLTDDEKAAAFDPPRAKCCVPAPSVRHSIRPATS